MFEPALGCIQLFWSDVDVVDSVKGQVHQNLGQSERRNNSAIPGKHRKIGRRTFLGVFIVPNGVLPEFLLGGLIYG